MKKFFYSFHSFGFHFTLIDRQYLKKLFIGVAFFISCLFNTNISYAQQGQALNFDGVASYVQLPIGLSGSYTKEVWINPTAADLTGYPNIITGTGTAIFLVNGVLSAGNAPTYNQVLDTTATTLVAGTWYYIAVTYDSATSEMKLYENGILVADSINAAPTTYTEPSLNLGTFAGGNFWAGNMDEVRIWNVVRTQAQISGSMNCALTGDEPGLIAYYNFNEGIAGAANPTITTLFDSSDKCIANNGTLMNFALTGTTSNWVSPGAPLTGGCTNVYPNIRVSGNSTCITSGESTPSSTDSTDFGTFGVTPITVNYTVSSTGGVPLTISNITLSGANAASFSIVSMPPAIIPAGSSGILQVTFSPAGSLGTKYATITINNNDAGDSIFTYAIQGEDAGRGQALAFNGLNNYVQLPVSLSGSYTKEAWINTGITSGYPNILSGTGTAIFLNNGQLSAGNAPGFNQVLDTTTTDSIYVGTWHHVAVTYDSTNSEMKLYKDGVLVADSVNAVPTSYTEPSLNIGTFAGGYYWYGKIDEVRIWNIVRTPAQIAGSMNCALTGDEYGLVAYYNFNEGVEGAPNPGDTILYDSSHKCMVYNGILENFTLTDTLSNWIAPGAPLNGGCVNDTFPNINVTGNSICIVNGDSTPVTTNYTNFGTSGSLPISETFIIQNIGKAILNIDSAKITGTDSLDFIITSAPASSIAPGGSTSITVEFLPLAVGLRQADITIFNDDSDAVIFNYEIQATSTVVLPVNLLSFTGAINGQSVKLNWKTSAELNNRGFEIQRSADGVSGWVNLGFVAASSLGAYNFTDASPLSGVNTYRLEQIDLNGNTKFSQIVAFDFSAKSSGIAVYPNPAKDKVNILSNNNGLINTPVQLSTITGRVLSTIILKGNLQEVDLTQLPQGIYLLTFSNGDVERIIKQ